MRNRSVVELMTLMFTVVVVCVLLGSTAIVLLVEVRDPDTDTSAIVQGLLTLISGILGALLGLLAGRSSGGEDLHRRPNDPPGGGDAASH